MRSQEETGDLQFRNQKKRAAGVLHACARTQHGHHSAVPVCKYQTCRQSATAHPICQTCNPDTQTGHHSLIELAGCMSNPLEVNPKLQREQVCSGEFERAIGSAPVARPPTFASKKARATLRCQTSNDFDSQESKFCRYQRTNVSSCSGETCAE